MGIHYYHVCPFYLFLFSKEQKILVAISCLLILVTLAGGFYAFAASQTKSRMQNTPTSAHNNIPTTINTSNAVTTPTHTSVPSPASSSTPGTITYPVTLQPPPNVKSTPTAHPTPTPTPTTQTPDGSPSPTPTAISSSSSTSTAMLNVTPVQLSNSNCARRTINSYRCTVQLSLNASGSGRQTWIAYSTGVTAQIIPFIGTITAGHTTPVTIIVFDTCKHPGAFVFTVGRAKVSTIVIWAC